MKDEQITAGKAMELLYGSLPYPDQIKDIDLKENAIYFTWRWARYKFDYSGGYLRVDQSDGYMVTRDTTSLLMTELIKRKHFAIKLAES